MEVEEDVQEAKDKFTKFVMETAQQIGGMTFRDRGGKQKLLRRILQTGFPIS